MEVYKLVKTSDAPDVPGLERFGHQTELPTPHFEVPAAAYYAVAADAILNHVDYRFVPGVGTARIEWYDVAAFAVFYSALYPPKFYRIGCVHEWAPLPKTGAGEVPKIGRGRHVDQCAKCGIIQETDSSD